eukprot:3433097-Rhodomonas_salina.1
MSSFTLSQQAPFMATFTITARDEYENLLDGTSSETLFTAKAVSADGASGQLGRLQSTALVPQNTVLPSELVVTLSLTVSAHYRLVVSGLSEPGLLGVYYSDSQCRTVSRARIDPDVDFSWGDGPAHDGGPADNFCVRWTGFLYVTASDDYVFQLEADHVATASVDGFIVQQTKSDLSSALDERATRQSVFLSEGVGYPFKISYWSGEGPSWIKVSWSTLSTMGQDDLTIITSSNLYAESTAIGNVADPLELTVTAGECCSTTSAAFGSGLSHVLAGFPAKFAIRCKDEYQNPVTSSGATFQITASAHSFKMRYLRSATTIADQGNGNFEVAYQLTPPAGQYSIHVQQLVAAGAIHATYYNDDALLVPSSSRLDTSIDFSSSTGEVPAASLTAGT